MLAMVVGGQVQFFLERLEKISKNFATSQNFRRGKRERCQDQVNLFKKNGSPDEDGNLTRPGSPGRRGQGRWRRFWQFFHQKIWKWGKIQKKVTFQSSDALKNCPGNPELTLKVLKRRRTSLVRLNFRKILKSEVLLSWTGPSTVALRPLGSVQGPPDSF